MSFFKGKPLLEETPMRTVRVRWICPGCAAGEMRHTGFSQASNPMGYWHECSDPKCGFKACLDRRYPAIEHRDSE